MSIPTRFPRPDGMTMLDLSPRLRENAHLLSLLSHYARLGADDRAVWQDRVTELDGVGPEGMSRLHGELLAFGGIEQNTGNAVLRPDGTVGNCYRVTATGLREYRRLNGIEDEVEQPEEIEKPPPRVPRKKKASSEQPAATSAE